VSGCFGHRKKFCSQSCKKQHGVKSLPAKREMVCQGCHEVFFGNIRKERKFCGTKCRGLYGYRPNPKNSVIEHCNVCGDPVEVQPHRRKRNSSGLFFCSAEHANIWQGSEKIGGECEVCGKSFSRSPSFLRRGKNKFCSNECRYKSKDFETQIGRMVSKQQNAGINKLEKLGYQTLEELGIQYLPQHVIGNKFCVDAFIPTLNIVVQFDGDYWHGNKSRFPKLSPRQEKRVKLDQSQDKYFEACGFWVVRIWESEFKKDIDLVKNKILERIAARERQQSQA
jgi:very-short-patch-repair endonuclease